MTSILGLSKGGGKSGGSGSSGSSNSTSSGTEIDNLSNTLLTKLLNSEEFGSRVTNVILDTIRVNQITSKFAKFEGLANGTTTIDGRCIMTGYIIDNNYDGATTTGGIDNTSGTIINLETGQFNFGGGKLVYNGTTLSIEGNIVTNSPLSAVGM